MDGSAYATIGVVLFVVGCVLSIVASALRTARPTTHATGGPTATPVRTTSASVARLRRDVSDWAKRS